MPSSSCNQQSILQKQSSCFLCDQVVGHGAPSPVSQWAVTDAGGQYLSLDRKHALSSLQTPTSHTHTHTSHTRGCEAQLQDARQSSARPNDERESQTFPALFHNKKEEEGWGYKELGCTRLTGMVAGMADLLPRLLICLMVAETVQLNGKSVVFVFSRLVCLFSGYFTWFHSMSKKRDPSLRGLKRCSQ